MGDLQISKIYCLPYQEVTVCEVGEEDFPRTMGDQRFQALALLTLQEAAEACVIKLFEDANLCAVNAKWISLMAKDIQLAHRIWGDMVKYLSV